MASRLGKMPTESVRRRIFLLRRSWGLLDQICRHTSTGKAEVGQQVSSRGVEVVSGLGQQVTGVVQEAVELGLDGCCVGLVVNRVEHGLEGRPGALGGHFHQVGGVVGAAALPGRSGQVRGDGLDQTRVGVRGDKSYPSQASGDQVGEELVPRCSALAGGYPQAQDFAVSVSVDPSGCQDHRTDHATAFADLHGQGVGRYEDEGAGVAQGPVAEGGDVLVELGRHA